MNKRLSNPEESHPLNKRLDFNINLKSLLLITILSLIFVLQSDKIEGRDKLNHNGGKIKNCKFKGITLKGRVKLVSSFPNIKIKFVENFPDIKVKIVTSFPDDCGKWQMVESFPDFTVQVVDSFPDIKVQTVDSFPGVP